MRHETLGQRESVVKIVTSRWRGAPPSSLWRG